MKALSFVGKSKNTNKLAFRVITLTAMFLGVVFLQGCEQISYYSQAVQGHIKIMTSQKPIEELLEAPETSPKLKERLQDVLSALDFAEHQLSITQAQTNYRSYVELNRKYPVWSVTAAPDDSLTPKQWCYPFVGCASYRGYYSEEAAQAYAQTIFNEGHMDVHVGGADAYSTLGWFDDPVLSTFFRRDKIGLHALIFHELAHQVLYLKGDSTFNESFASAVEETGVELWLQEQPELLDTFHQRKVRSADFIGLLKETQQELNTAYQELSTREEKLEQKAKIIEQLQEKYQQLKTTKWDGYTGYDHWFSKPVNNARLALVSTYNHYVPAFKRWIQVCDYNYPAFYEAASVLAEQDKQERERVLTQFESIQHPTNDDKADAPSLLCKYSPNN
ncbi:aminopeptidase [Litoribrevibacter albus]|uniref:Aminopeptidase n=1 Tax=Litoribrevibacter albus TaxID=1473156 RepID=A0AA37SDI8_9GAMM|nr:aminopeptidase [Litoribrevibacter albus]GLQ32403.1 aminopeptidase [Litoribrevibacter albus]